MVGNVCSCSILDFNQVILAWFPILTKYTTCYCIMMLILQGIPAGSTSRLKT